MVFRDRVGGCVRRIAGGHFDWYGAAWAGARRTCVVTSCADGPPGSDAFALCRHDLDPVLFRWWRRGVLIAAGHLDALLWSRRTGDSGVCSSTHSFPGSGRAALGRPDLVAGASLVRAYDGISVWAGAYRLGRR